MELDVATFHWPTHALPTLRLAGRFPLARKDFAFTYLGGVHAIHVHGYDGRIQIADKIYELQPGDVTITPAGVESRYDLRRPGLHWCAHFSPMIADATKCGLMRLPHHFRPTVSRDYPAQQMAHIAQLHARSVTIPDDGIASASVAVALQTLLLWVATQHQRQQTGGADSDSRGELAVERCATLIETKLSKAITVPALADEVELSQNHLAKLFRARFGTTIPRYVLTRRMAQARHLLISTNVPIGEIGRRVGMPDAQHFNKQFKRLVGENPTDVRTRGRVTAKI